MSTTAGALGFLTTGATPGSATGETQSSSQLPAWYQDYTQQILNTAAQFAAQPYQAYQGPRIANQDALTNSAYSGAAGLGATAASGTQAAQNLIQQGAGENNPTGAAQPYLNAGANDINSSLGQSGLSAGSPYLNSGAQGLAASTAPGSSGLAAASPYLSAGAQGLTASVGQGTGGLAAASPYLNSAATPTYDTIQNYLNPYNQNVTDAIARAGASNFNNNIMPALNSSQIGAGNITGTSTEGAQLANNAALTEQQAVSQAQAGALQSGYQSSQTAAQNAAALQAQLGSTAGSLGTQQQTAQQNAATGLASIGATTGQLGTQQQTAQQNAATGIANIGTSLGQLGTQQQTATQNAGADLANIGVSAGQLNTQQAQNAITAGGALSNVNTQGLNNQTSALGTQNSLGQQNQAYNQSNLNTAYQDYLNQLNYPITQASVMQGALSGIQVPTANTSYNYGTSTPSTISNSPLVTAAGALSGLSASTTQPG